MPDAGDMSHAEYASLYETIARTLPQEGRDYHIEFSRAQSGRPAARLVPLNDLGASWVPFVHMALSGRNPFSATEESDGMTQEMAAQLIRAGADR